MTQDQSMIERVARALHRASHESGRRLYPQGAWESLDRFEQGVWMFSARAALFELTEPTKEMREAGCAISRLHIAETALNLHRDAIGPAAYLVMIDAALSDPTP